MLYIVGVYKFFLLHFHQKNGPTKVDFQKKTKPLQTIERKKLKKEGTPRNNYKSLMGELHPLIPASNIDFILQA